MAATPQPRQVAIETPRPRATRPSPRHRRSLAWRLSSLFAVPCLRRRAALIQDLFFILTMLVLAQYWNLLAGYAGLVSVGQQAFVGLGAYALFAARRSCSASIRSLAICLPAVAAALLALPTALLRVPPAAAPISPSAPG